MAKKQKMINSSECEKCKFCKIEEISKAKIVIHCEAKGKDYLYGQFIPCDNMTKK